MRLALKLIWIMWNRQENPENFTLAITFGNPNSKLDKEITIHNVIPTLVFHQGSMDVSLFKKVGLEARRVFSTLTLCLSPKQGIFPSHQGDYIVQGLRNAKLLEEQYFPLERIQDIKREQLREKKCLIILIPGFFSTDVGLFDNLITELKKDPFIQNEVKFCGYPHNTLSGVEDNAKDLRLKLIRLFRDGDLETKVVFVCHSRGGLVARCTALKLFQDDKWKLRLAGCVTYGTPHEGMALAETSGRLQGVFLIWQMLKHSLGLPPVNDLWSHLGQNTQIRGISDLKPRSITDSFVSALFDKESDENIENGGGQRLPILAIGGKRHESNGAAIKIDGIESQIYDNFLKTDKHDWVVETASSTSQHVYPDQAEVECNHFQYFLEDQVKMDTSKRVLKFIKTCLIKSST